MKLSRHIKIRRRNLKCSQIEAANQIGISVSSLRDIEQGKPAGSFTETKIRAWLGNGTEKVNPGASLSEQTPSTQEIRQ